MMTEPTSSAAGVALVKLYGLKVIAGAIAAGIGFAVLWPRSKAEGVARIICTIACSALFGDAAANAIDNFAPWLLGASDAARMPVYAMAGLPGWWVLGWLVKWLDNRRERDLGQVIDEVRRGRL